MPKVKKDYYGTLGVPRSATTQEIIIAHRELAKKYHSDRNPDQNDGKMAEINVAYDTLKNPEKRKIYDKELGLKNNKISSVNKTFERILEQYFQTRRNVQIAKVIIALFIISFCATIILFFVAF